MNDDLEGALINFMELLRQEEYFDAHEVLEEAWHPLRIKKHPLSNLVKGLINGAIAFEHIKRDKKKSRDRASKVICSFIRYRDLYTTSIEYSSLFQDAIGEIEKLMERDCLIPTCKSQR